MQRKALIGVGILICLFSVSRGHGLFNPMLLVGIAVAILGWKWAVQPALPAGFNASFRNRNIALDTTAASLWVRDQDGTTAILQRDEILGWEMSSNTGAFQTNIGPRVVHLDTKLLVKTRNLSKPVWTVPFNDHFSRSVSGGRANRRELDEWFARLNAFYNLPARQSQVQSAGN